VTFSTSYAKGVDTFAVDMRIWGMPRAVNTIIEKFGGMSALARATGLSVSTVQGWKERGQIPARRIPEVRRAAKESLGLELRFRDFFDED
jgi:hypothetical protein